MHEVREQFLKAKGEKNYNNAHLKGGLYWENLVNGNVRLPKEFNENQKFYRDLSGGKRTNLQLISTWSVTKTPIITKSSIKSLCEIYISLL